MKPLSIRPVTNSEISDLQRCERMHWLGNSRNLTSVDPPSPLKAAELGTRFHKIAERYYKGETAESLQQELDDLTAEPDVDKDEARARVILAAMWEGYVEWLAEYGADSGLTSLGAEGKFQREFEGLVYQGMLDLPVLIAETGEVLIIDFKTTAKSLNDKTIELTFTRQLAFYAWLLQAKGFTVKRIRLRIIRQSSRSDRTEGPYVTEIELPVTAARLVTVEHQLRILGPRVLAARNETELPIPTPDMDCAWRCPFSGVCTAAEYGEDWEAILTDQFVVHDPLERYKS